MDSRFTRKRGNDENHSILNKWMEQIWDLYYPLDECNEKDPATLKRVHLIEFFYTFFTQSEPGQRIINPTHQGIHAEENEPPQNMTFEETKIRSIYVSYPDLLTALPPFADMSRPEDWKDFLHAQPREMLTGLSIACYLCRIEMFQLSRPMMHKKKNLPLKLQLRLLHVPVSTPLALVKANVLHSFVTIQGTVIRTSSIVPLVTKCPFICTRCEQEHVRTFEDGKFQPPTVCFSPCRSRSFVPNRNAVETVDSQRIRLQEINDSSTADPGRIPRNIEVELLDDLVDRCIPGDRVHLSGIVCHENACENQKGGGGGKRFQQHSLSILYLQANAMANVSTSNNSKSAQENTKLQDDDGTFSKEEIEKIQAIVDRPQVFDRLVHSLCPGIFGNCIVKAGILLCLFGGTDYQNIATTRASSGGRQPQQSKKSKDYQRQRSDSHLLIVGDPGLGKSQMLRSVSEIAPRSVYVCGNTTTATGLTVTMTKDRHGETGLEAGALVLADQGICCIDEFDKMGFDYQALLEAMEQQRISIAKAGVVCNLNARTSIIAAANPAGGHYNRERSVSENLKMKAALLSRFDLIFVLLDRPDAHRDQLLSEHVMQIHVSKKKKPNRESDATSNTRVSSERTSDQVLPLGERLNQSSFEMKSRAERIPIDTLKTYVRYAKKYIHPKLSTTAAQVLQEMYMEMRESASKTSGSVPITTRQLESLIRLAQARAKLELRALVTEQDALDVIEILKESMLDTLTTESGELDFGRSGGISLAKKVKAFIQRLKLDVVVRNSDMYTFDQLLDVANQMALKVDDFWTFLEILRNECYLLKKGPKLYKVQIAAY